jgi:hypothetical protein
MSVTEDFTANIRHSLNPFIVLFVGRRRVGKSTTANHFIRQVAQLGGPFETSSAWTPSAGFHYAGPFSFQDIAALHDVAPDRYPPADVFVVDCPGYDRLRAKEISMERSFAVLAPLVGLVVLVTGYQEPDALLAESES